MFGLILMLSQFGAIDVSPMGVVDRPAQSKQFSYDSVESKGKRKAPPVTYQSEDLVLNQGKRDKAIANARDLIRNFPTAAWAIRQHLNYVASFRYQCGNKDKGLNRAIEELMTNWSRPENCDIAARHRLSRFVRLVEIRKILDGDMGVMRLASGHLNGIEGDKIRNVRGVPSDGRIVNGVKVNGAGKALSYALHKRTPQGRLDFDRMVPANNMFLHGAYDRFDQTRGISPINAGLNQFRDVYENFDYALAKAKVTQLFAIAFYRDAEEAAGEVFEDDDVDGSAEDGTESTTSAPQGPRYKVDPGRGPNILDLDPGDKAEVIESAQPSTQFQEFTKLVQQVALKSLDIPYSFFDESHTNFFGSRGAWLHYERSCEEKREDLQDLLYWITTWRMLLWILDDELKLPSKMTLADLVWEWVPVGMPWWDPAKEITGEEKAIKGGLDNPYRIAKERGRGDVEDNIDLTARAIAYARTQGVILSYDVVGQMKAKQSATSSSPDAANVDDAAA